MEQAKKAFHAKARKFLRRVAADLELTDFGIRTNKGGPAVIGESILHASDIYIQVGSLFSVPHVMYRWCDGRKDYCGGRNRYAPYTALSNEADYKKALRGFFQARLDQN